jgi:predicted nucleotidyltransferase
MMKTLEEIKSVLAANRDELNKRFKVKSIRLFGSYVRGDQSNKSDLDVMVEFEEPVGFEFFHLADFLESILGIPVDLTTEDAIKPNRLSRVREDAVYV